MILKRQVSSPIRPTKIPVLATVAKGYTFLFAHAKDFAWLSLGPAVLLVGIWTFFDWLDSPGSDQSSTEPIRNLAHIVQAWFALRWYRLYLLQRPLSTSGQHIWRFIISAGVFLIVWALVIIISTTLLSMPLVAYMSADDEAGRTGKVIGIAIILMLCLFYPISALMFRFVAVFPAMAMELPGALDRTWRARLGDSWRLTKGNGCRLTSAMVLIALPLFIGSLAISMLFFQAPESHDIVFMVLHNVLLALGTMASVAVTSGCNAEVYITLGGSEEKCVSDPPA